MAVRRLKSYTGQTGYVYQYYFVGSRPSRNSAVAGTEYIFDVTADRKTMFAVTVAIRRESLEGWALTHGRQLSGTEQYASAKMRLFQAFDNVEKMMEDGRHLQVDSGNIEELLAPLELDG
ncbi:MAG TPA: hypothetical protein VN622_15110 [Clostridia bacterium]|nr:hypothetical protein [Clostridia bacterium]